MSETNGLSKRRPRTCQRCGVVFTATKATARYCSDPCRKASSRYGRSYGTVIPRDLGWTKS